MVMGQCRPSERLSQHTSRLIWLHPGKRVLCFQSKPCRITSALVGKSYIAAGQAMDRLQAYQAELLKELDESEGLSPEAVKELRRHT